MRGNKPLGELPKLLGEFPKPLGELPKPLGEFPKPLGEFPYPFVYQLYGLTGDDVKIIESANRM